MPPRRTKQSKPQAKKVFRSKLLEDAVFNGTKSKQTTTSTLDDNTKAFVKTMFNKFKTDFKLKSASNIVWFGKYHKNLRDFIVNNYKSNNTQQSYLNSLAKVMLAVDKKKLKETVRGYLETATNQKNAFLKTQDKSELTDRQVANFVCFGDTVNERDRLKKISDKDPKNFSKHQDFLILALNTYIPPLRLDWTDMEVWKQKKKPPTDVHQNYLYAEGKGKWMYLINWDKVESKRDPGLSDPLSYKIGAEISQGAVQITEGKKMNEILTDSFKRFPRKWVLMGTQRMDSSLESTGGIGSIFKKIFKPKEPTQNTFRKSYINHWYDSLKLSTETKKKIASRMRHDIKTAASEYVKINIDCPVDGYKDIIGVQEKEVVAVQRQKIKKASEFFNVGSYMKDWRSNNTDKVKEYRKKAYDKNKLWILATKQLHYLNHNQVKKPTQASVDKYMLRKDEETEKWVTDLEPPKKKA